MNTRNLLVSVLMLVSILLSACAPAATPTVAEPVVAPTTDPVTADALTTRPFHLFDLPVSVSFDAEWSVVETYTDVFTLKYTGHDAGLSFINVEYAKIGSPDAVVFPDDFVSWIQSPDSLFQIAESKSVLVDGFPGIQINAIAACGNNTDWIILRETSWKCPNGEHIGFIYLSDVHGERVLIQIQGSPDGEDYQFIVEESQKVLDTVVFSRPQTTFSPKTFKLLMSVSFGSDWRVAEDLSDTLAIENGPTVAIVFNVVTDAQLVDPLDGHLIPFPDDFIPWILSNPDFNTSEPTQVIIGGISGVQIDAMPIMKTNKKSFGLNWNLLNSDGQYRFILFDNVNGDRLLIFIVAPTGKTFSAVPELQQEVQGILDSVVFNK